MWRVTFRGDSSINRHVLEAETSMFGVNDRRHEARISSMLLIVGPSEGLVALVDPVVFDLGSVANQVLGYVFSVHTSV